ncbi:hypothetical protein NDU88_012824 [Pleurodeles waltl]|uniref:Uncharacterized protein n=1 Tax=Pleurodeles waltl TaxID=8319 RepID=A0AAV7R171_PLEWA|nr:hypothetical protein NDU88_012824 [Pleurodeles waltl]
MRRSYSHLSRRDRFQKEREEARPCLNITPEVLPSLESDPIIFSFANGCFPEIPLICKKRGPQIVALVLASARRFSAEETSGTFGNEVEGRVAGRAVIGWSRTSPFADRV